MGIIRKAATEPITLDLSSHHACTDPAPRLPHVTSDDGVTTCGYCMPTEGRPFCTYCAPEPCRIVPTDGAATLAEAWCLTHDAPATLPASWGYVADATRAALALDLAHTV